MNLQFGSELFWNVVDSDAYPVIRKAYEESVNEETKFKADILRSQYWIAHIMSDFGTGVLRTLGHKNLRTSLAEHYRKAIWEPESIEVDNRKEMEITQEEFAMWASV